MLGHAFCAKLSSMAEWSDYQEEVARFFRSIGLQADTNVTLKGIRTSHDIDVVVRSNHVGFDLLWLVECKHWKTAVSKLHVLALREIVSDLGADRGILMAENGFQSGAQEAAQLTNVQLTSLAELTTTASDALGKAQLHTLQERVAKCREQYWDLDRDTRIKYGLRDDPGGGYSGFHVLQILDAALTSASRGQLPVIGTAPFGEIAIAMADPKLRAAKTLNELLEHLEPMVADLEVRLNVPEILQVRQTDLGAHLATRHTIT
jgi:restriction system protein